MDQPKAGRTTFPNEFVSLIRTGYEHNPQPPAELWDKLHEQMSTNGVQLERSIRMPFGGEYDILLLGHTRTPDDLLRINETLQQVPGVIRSWTQPGVEGKVFYGAGQERERVAERVGATAGARSA